MGSAKAQALRAARRGRGLAALALLLAALPAAGQVLQSPSGVPLGLAGPVAPAKDDRAVYIVKLRDEGAASRRGQVAVVASAKPASGAVLGRTAAATRAYAQRLEQSHDRLLADIGAAGSKLYSFRYALNGFAARLRADQVSRLARRGEVERIWPDTLHRLATNNSSAFLGLQDVEGGLRADLGYTGEDVVIGVIDSGIAPGHPSLRDVVEHMPRACESRWARASWLGRWLCHSIRRDPPTELVYDPPLGWNGVCQEGEGFTRADCNNKVIGARFYLEGFLAQHELDPNEFASPRDADGHGTHVATIAAGNSSVSAWLFGTRLGRVSGIAPRARVAVYKACWRAVGEQGSLCATSDLTRAIDDAVADGVDIISYSVGTTLGETDLTAPDDLALLNALDAGVLAVVAAGNDGPELATISSPASAPWVMTVAASTQTGNVYDDAIAVTAPDDLARALPMREASFTPPLRDGAGAEARLVLVDDGVAQLPNGATGSPRDACEPLTNGAELRGNIALIERGGCEFQDKVRRAEQAGAVAAVVYNTSGGPIAMNGDSGSVGIPAVMIGASDGQLLVNRLTDGEDVTVAVRRGIFAEVRRNGNVMAEFSSRGPATSDPNFLKPDVTAPGVDILAGHTPQPASGLQGETFQYLSGTSQAAPQVAGLAALLLEAHPDWPPSAIKSALMTSARQNVLREPEIDADPLDMGAGHVDPNRAVDPGLTYDNGLLDHAAYLCGLERSPFRVEDCDAVLAAGYPADPTQLNLPSIAVAELVTGDVVTRVVTNRAGPATFTASVSAPPGIEVIVDPPSLALGAGQTGEFALTFLDHGGSPLDQWAFGQLVWSDGARRVASPIALRPVALRVPTRINLLGEEGTIDVPIAFNYNGEYIASLHGLAAPSTVQEGFVEDDPTNEFTFRIGNGVRMHELPEVPADALYLRVALFDELTDGLDDLDLYLFYCPDNLCTQIGQSGRFSSEEEIDVFEPQAGRYVALVHGFETDETAGGPGARYTLFAWTLDQEHDADSLQYAAPSTVAAGDRFDVELRWSVDDPSTRYLGAILHATAEGPYALSVIRVNPF
ncbi:MAG TPA: S8 family serine peptidase [Gammaproteobacteria bacterium]